MYTGMTFLLLAFHENFSITCLHSHKLCKIIDIHSNAIHDNVYNVIYIFNWHFTRNLLSVLLSAPILISSMIPSLRFPLLITISWNYVHFVAKS